MHIESSDFTPSDGFQTREELNAFFRRLHDLNGAYRRKGDKHDRATILICACIDEGVDTGPRIVGTLKRLDFNAKHVGRWLHDHAGSDPARHYWHRDETGRYTNLC